MSHEIRNSDSFAWAELAFGYELHDAAARGSTGEVVSYELNDLQLRTYCSVLRDLAIARYAERQEWSAVGERPANEDLPPSEETLAAIQAKHIGTQKYLRMRKGLRARYEQLTRPNYEDDEPPYDHHIEAIASLVAYFDTNDPGTAALTGGFSELPTGGGNARTIVDAVAAMKSQEDPTDPINIFIGSGDRAGVNELVGGDGQNGFGKYARHIPVSRLNLQNPSSGETVVVGTRDGTRLMLQRDPNIVRHYNAFFLDKAHRFLGKVTRGLIEDLIDRPIFGLTATGTFNPQRKVADLLPSRLSERETRVLIENGTLSPVQTWIYKTNFVPDIDRQRNKCNDFTLPELHGIANLTGRADVAIKFALAFLGDNRRGATSCNTIQEADAIAEAMNGLSIVTFEGEEKIIRAAAVHGKKRGSAVLFDKLDAGELDWVTIVNMDESWNAPSVSALVNARQTYARVKGKQRDGRIFRRYYDDAGRLVTAQIVDIIDTFRPVKNCEGGMVSPRIVLAAQLLGETKYVPGQFFGNPNNTEPCKDFSLDQFPAELHQGLTRAAGTELSKIAMFGFGTHRQTGKAERFTVSEAAMGLGIHPVELERLASRLRLPLDDKTLTHVGIEKIAGYLLEIDAPITW